MPPTTQIHNTRLGEPRSLARNPVPVKIPVPTILETTSAVALTRPSWRSSPDLPAVTISSYEFACVRVTHRDIFCTFYRCRRGRDRCVRLCRRVPEEAPPLVLRRSLPQLQIRDRAQPGVAFRPGRT